MQLSHLRTREKRDNQQIKTEQKDKRNAHKNGSVPNNPRKRGKKNKRNQIETQHQLKQNKVNEKQDQITPWRFRARQLGG